MTNKLTDCPVKCLQHEGELQEFLKIYSEIKPKNILEIGTFFGGTLWFFIKNNPNLEKIVVVDMPIPAYDERFQQMMESRTQWQDWIPELTQFQNYAGNSHELSLITNVKSNNEENDIDMLHIDGDHTYDGVKADYYNFKDMVRPGGMIVFHDVVGIPDVAQFWNELIQELPPNSYKVISHEGGWGIGIIQTASENSSEIDRNTTSAEKPAEVKTKTTIFNLSRKPLTFTEYRQENAIAVSNAFQKDENPFYSHPGFSYKTCVEIFAYYSYLHYLNIFGYNSDEISFEYSELLALNDGAPEAIEDTLTKAELK